MGTCSLPVSHQGQAEVWVDELVAAHEGHPKLGWHQPPPRLDAHIPLAHLQQHSGFRGLRIRVLGNAGSSAYGAAAISCKRLARMPHDSDYDVIGGSPHQESNQGDLILRSRRKCCKAKEEWTSRR